MALDDFFPYRLALLAETVSRAVAQVYTTRFDLGRDEWRVLAALGEHETMKTAALIAHTNLEKMQASRAIARLEGSGRIARQHDPDDRRHHVLRLLPAGRAIVRKVMPLVRQREAFLLAQLDPGERAALDAALAKVLAQARALPAPRPGRPARP